MLFLLLLFFLVRGLELFADAREFPVSRWLLQTAGGIEQPALEMIRSNLPTQIKGVDVSRWILVGGLVLLWLQLTAFGDYLKTRARSRLYSLSATTTRKSTGQQASAAEQTFDPNLDREHLLELYTQSKKKLDQKKRQVAFLSLDVVGSTEMKRGEDPGVVERDFRHYRHLVEKIIAENHALKSSWTPDGVMICFGAAQEAVVSAQALIGQLDEFNQHTKTIRTDFTVRAGIHVGEILFDDTVHMEEISDITIDVTGHMQKYGPPNAVCLAQEVLPQLASPRDFKSANREVDGLSVYEWSNGG